TLSPASVTAGGVSLDDITYDQSDDFQKRKAELIVRISNHPLAKLNRRGKIDAPGLCHGSQTGTAVFCDLSIPAITCNNGCEFPQIEKAYQYPPPPKSNEDRTGIKEVNDENNKSKAETPGTSGRSKDTKRGTVPPKPAMPADRVFCLA